MSLLRHYSTDDGFGGLSDQLEDISGQITDLRNVTVKGFEMVVEEVKAEGKRTRAVVRIEAELTRGEVKRQGELTRENVTIGLTAMGDSVKAEIGKLDDVLSQKMDKLSLDIAALDGKMDRQGLGIE